MVIRSAAATVKRLIRAGFNSVGFDILRLRKSPTATLLGLRTLPFKTVIDVGANTGQFAKWISGIFPNAKVYCFEPLPQPFQALRAWADTQGGRIVPMNVAIGDSCGEAEFFFHEIHAPSSSLLPTTALSEQYFPFTKVQKAITVSKMTLDVALQGVRVDLASKILIKLDVQGYEDRVIAGGSETFRLASACIVEICLDALYQGQADLKQLISMLDDLGFQYAGNVDQTYGEDGHCIFVDAAFVRKT